jgi:response regulator RpfG family c-di-GMP phosphodiesterase
MANRVNLTRQQAPQPAVRRNAGTNTAIQPIIIKGTVTSGNLVNVKARLQALGHEVASIYFCAYRKVSPTERELYQGKKFRLIFRQIDKATGAEVPILKKYHAKAGEEIFVYDHIRNTFTSRSTILEEMFCNPPLVVSSTDALFLKGKTKGPMVVAPINVGSLIRYDLNTFIFKSGKVVKASSLIALLVRDQAGNPLGSINIALHDDYRALQRPDVREQIRQAIEEGLQDIPSAEAALAPLVERGWANEMTRDMARTPWYFFYLPGTQTIKDMLTRFEKVESLLGQSYREALLLLAHAIQLREPGTGRHSFSVMELCLPVLDELPDQIWTRSLPREIEAALESGQKTLPEVVQQIKAMFPAIALLHDIGKIGLRDSILQGTRELGDVAFSEMVNHVSNGKELLGHLGVENPMRQFAMLAVEDHHEDYDGLGYRRKKGQDISPIGRLLRVADSFDTITMERGYKKAETVVFALTEIVKGLGTMYDPEIVEAFLRTATGIKLVAENLLLEELKKHARAYEADAEALVPYMRQLTYGVTYAEVQLAMTADFCSRFDPLFALIEERMKYNQLGARNYLVIFEVLRQLNLFPATAAEFIDRQQPYDKRDRAIVMDFIDKMIEVYVRRHGDMTDATAEMINKKLMVERGKGALYKLLAKLLEAADDMAREPREKLQAEIREQTKQFEKECSLQEEALGTVQGEAYGAAAEREQLFDSLIALLKTTTDRLIGQWQPIWAEQPKKEGAIDPREYAARALKIEGFRKTLAYGIMRHLAYNGVELNVPSGRPEIMELRTAVLQEMEKTYGPQSWKHRQFEVFKELLYRNSSSDGQRR